MTDKNKGINVQTHIDVKLFANIVQLCEDKGIDMQGNASKIVREVLEVFETQLCKVKFPTAELAIAYLTSKGYSLAQLSPEDSRRGLKNQLEGDNIYLESREVEEGDKELAKSITEVLEKGTEDVSRKDN